MVAAGVAITILLGLLLTAVFCSSLRAVGGGRDTSGDRRVPPYDWERDGI